MMKPTRRQIQGLSLILFTLFSLATLCLSTYPFIFPQGKEPRLIGPDPYFHLRHAKAVLAHYPVIERQDFMTNFPKGETGLNQGFFDVGIATITKLTGGLISPLIALIFISPLCFIAIAVLIYGWMQQGFHPPSPLESTGSKIDEQAGSTRDVNLGLRCGGLFLLFLWLYPGPLVSVAALGQGDHHATEVLLATLVALGLYHLFQKPTSWRFAPLAALPLFLFYLTWPGTPLHLAIVGVIFFLQAWQKSPHADGSRTLALKGVSYGASLLIGLMIVSFAFPWAVIWKTSETLFIIGSTALVLGYPLLVAIAHRPWKRPVIIELGLVLLAIVLLIAIPSTRTEIIELLAPRTAQVAEHVPASLPIMISWYGFIWILALLAPLRLWWRESLGVSLVPLAYGSLLLFFWWQTRDFDYYSPPILAAAAAYTLGTFPWNRWTASAVIAAIGLALIPGTPTSKPWMDGPVVRETILYTDGLESASQWLKKIQGPPLPPQDRPYGLACPWDLGNVLAETADIPVGWSQTVSSDLARLFYTDNPDWAYDQFTKESKPLRYILLPARNLGEKFMGEMFAANLPLTSMFERSRTLKYNDQTWTIIKPSARQRESLIYRLYWNSANNLGHFRMVYESPQQAVQLLKLLPGSQLQLYAWLAGPKDLTTLLKPLLDHPNQALQTSRGLMTGGRQEAEVRIFEVVPGAILKGKAKPGSYVQAELELYAPTTERTWTSRWISQTDLSGAFTLRLPYSTQGAQPKTPETIYAKSAYQIKFDDKTFSLTVTENDVMEQHVLKLSGDPQPGSNGLKPPASPPSNERLKAPKHQK